MKDTFEFTLNNPLTEEQWDMITDVDFDRTDHVTFHTKHGKEVEFAKVIRCKDCRFCGDEPSEGTHVYICNRTLGSRCEGQRTAKGFCAWAERRGEE